MLRAIRLIQFGRFVFLGCVGMLGIIGMHGILGSLGVVGGRPKVGIAWIAVISVYLLFLFWMLYTFSAHCNLGMITFRLMCMLCLVTCARWWIFGMFSIPSRNSMLVLRVFLFSSYAWYAWNG